MAKKLTRAEKIRRYLTKNPSAKISDVAKEFGTTYQIVYMIRKNAGAKINMTATEVAVASKLGVPTVEYAKQKSKILEAPKKKAAPLPTLETKDGYLYTWVNTNGLSEEVKAKLAERLNPETITMEEPQSDPVNHPAHYKVGGIETIDFIEAKQLNYNMGNAVKYISRADHKGNKKQDLEKAVWYLNRELAKFGE
jgi:hypothetical protein